MPLTVYCTNADMERLFSAQGVESFSDHDNDGAADAGVVDDCINQASEEINLYAGEFYSYSALSGSTLINRWCTVLAVYFLCQRRGNPAPDSIVNEFERIMANLERVRQGDMKLPGVAYKSDFRPSISNMRPVRGAIDGPIRVDTVTSPNVPTALPQKNTMNGGRLYA